MNEFYTKQNRANEDSTESGATRIAGKKRFFKFAVCFAIAAAAVVIHYAVLMLSPRKPPRAVQLEHTAGRGTILDRNGRVLALESRMGDITLWRPTMGNVEELSRELSPFLEQTPDEILNKITTSPSDFIYLRRQINESTMRLVEAAIASGRLRGVSVHPVPGRIYPERELAAQLIGFVGNDNTGLAGVEFAFNDELASHTRQNAKARDKRFGNQIFLTLDINVQNILEDISRRVLEQTRAEAVMFMAMDPRNGDVLGSVSLPGFDPNSIQTSNPVSRMDRPAIWAFEPGSTFKIFSLAALMEAGVIGEDTQFECKGYYERITARGERIVINCLGVHGKVTPREIIVLSCNAGAAYAADRMSTHEFHDRLRDFGFGVRTGAGNPGETAGFFRPADQWSERSRPTISMGQEISVSALQLLKATTAIANDGILVSPRIISRIVEPDGTVRTFQPEMPRRLLSPKVSRAIRSYMLDTTSSLGTGWRAHVQDLSLGVKTGTAQMINPANGAYSTTDFISNTVAILPAENPSLVLYLAIIKPQGEVLAGRIAAPPIRDAADALINYLGIPRGSNQQIAHSGAIPIPALPYPVINDIMPNFAGVAKGQLVPLLLRGDLQIQIYGDGWVARQSPAPGSPLTQDTVIILELEN
ncbi:MAG: penicillin-binding transpeptidase domain-containing protein [Treponema sp.]|nr:penicillin-binding transpeptidase domain-containing protein [Treponema sp.]